MKRELRLSEDGSLTFYVPELDETYHSIHGAIQESIHVFIRQGFDLVYKSQVHILEIGMGTGLNVLLSLRESEKKSIGAHYHTVERFPLTAAEYSRLNYENLIKGIPEGMLTKLHTAPWNQTFNLTEEFTVFKEFSDFRSMKPGGHFDLVYFDAFAPGKQPELWTTKIFTGIFHKMNNGAILVSYTSRGDVRRNLLSCGFEVEKIPGPPGKREMIRAWKR